MNPAEWISLSLQGIMAILFALTVWAIFTGKLQGQQGEKGDFIKGDKGNSIKGDRGPAGSIVIASVDTCEPGSQASVTNSGTPENAILHFRIPRGREGQDSISLRGGRTRMVQIFKHGAAYHRVEYGSQHHVEVCKRMRVAQERGEASTVTVSAEDVLNG